MKKLLSLLLVLIATSSFGQIYFDTYKYGGPLVKSESSLNELRYSVDEEILVVKEFNYHHDLVDRMDFKILSTKTNVDYVRYTVQTIEGDSFDMLFFTPTDKVESLIAYEFEDTYILIYGDIVY